MTLSSKTRSRMIAFAFTGSVMSLCIAAAITLRMIQLPSDLASSALTACTLVSIACFGIGGLTLAFRSPSK